MLMHFIDHEFKYKISLIKYVKRWQRLRNWSSIQKFWVRFPLFQAIIEKEHCKFLSEIFIFILKLSAAF